MKTFYITWYRLAERLVLTGHEVDRCQNLRMPEKDAWKVELTKKAAETIRDFYRENGKPVPGIVSDALEPGRDHE